MGSAAETRQENAEKPLGGILAGTTTIMVEALLTRLCLSEAADYARRGKYQQAEETLRVLGPSGRIQSLPALDLLARIRAQQGRLAEAEALWRSAHKQDPTNEGCVAGLARLQKDARRAVHLGHFWLRAAMASLVIVAGLASFALVGATMHSNRRLTSALAQVGAFQDRVEGALASLADSSDAEARRLSTLEAQSKETRSELVGLGQALNALLTTPAVAAQPTSTPVPERPGSLEGVVSALSELGPERVSIQQGNGYIVLNFTQGLFRNGTDFSPEAPDLISAVGSVIRERLAGLRVVLVGYSDPGEADGEFHGISLGLLRAAKVAEYLQDAVQVPASAIAVELPGDRPPPYPNDSPENQLRNRTVILVIEFEEP